MFAGIGNQILYLASGLLFLLFVGGMFVGNKWVNNTFPGSYDKCISWFCLCLDVGLDRGEVGVNGVGDDVIQIHISRTSFDSE